MAGTVLLVEDEPSVGELVRAYLTRDGYRVIWVRSGEDALTELDRHPVRMVLLDIGLPGKDGFDVCREIRGRSQVPILMLTARDEEPDRVVGLEVGADDYLTKPFSPRELVARMKAIFRRTGDARLTRARPHDDVAVRELRLLEPRLRAPQHGANAREQLARRERLREVVVGAELEPADAIGLLVARRQHDDGHARPRSDLPAHIEAVHVGQADVEDDDAHRITLELGECIAAAARQHDVEAVAFEV